MSELLRDESGVVLASMAEANCAVLPSRPPYAMAPTPFRFPAVAALAGRAPLGGQREVVLGTFLAARLALDTHPDRGLTPAGRVDRALQARTWLSTMTIPSAVRSALLHVIDASTQEPAAAAEAVRVLLTATAPFLDARSKMELERLAAALDR